MKLNPTAINSPLALIALFVAIIELFLMYPISQLDGWDRSILVTFIIAYPVFIAGSFFVFLWNKPVNLYTPQTLSENLQQALLPERLNNQLAPDRAAVAAIELKIVSLETQIRDVSQRMQTSIGMVEKGDIAKFSDLEALKAELLSRAEASGDVSRIGLTLAAKEFQNVEAEKLSARIAVTSNELQEFTVWMRKNGLKESAPIPQINEHIDTESGPTIGGGHITLGPPNRDYLVPGLYLYSVAEKAEFNRSIESGTFELIWTVADYMASSFKGIAFPDEKGPVSSAASSSVDLMKWYSLLYGLFSNLTKTVGRRFVDVGIVNMFNNLNSSTDLNAALALIAKGMVEFGADAETVSAVFRKYSSELAVPQIPK